MTKRKIPVVTIDTGVPIPGVSEWPLEQLLTGESFVFPIEKRSYIQSRATLLKKRDGVEFRIRKETEKSCRVWCIYRPDEQPKGDQ